MDNWLWVGLGIGALALFAFGRGGCGMGHGAHDHGHGDHGNKDLKREPAPAPSLMPPKAEAAILQTGERERGAPLASQSALEHAGHGSAAQQTGSPPHRHGC